MNGLALYDWDDIKRQGDCIRFVREVLKIDVSSDNRCAAVWRGGSRENSVALERDQWIDFGNNQEGGSIIDLCAVAQFGGDLFEASRFLGEWLGLEPKASAKVSRRIVATYDYTDADGKLVMQVVRFDPKDFRQRQPDPSKPDGWNWSVKDIVPPLYRLADLRETKWVCIVGGEKDTDNLRAIGIPATCNAGGETKKWLDAYTPELAGKSVVIIADKDDAGRAHAQDVAYAIRGVTKTLRILELPDRDGPVKDASDWIEQGGTREELLAIIKDTPRMIADDIAPPREPSAAKKANARPFANYDWVEADDGSGGKKAVRQPRKVMAMLNDMQTRFWGFPARLGLTLFDHDRRTNEIRFLDGSAPLMAWIAEKSGHQVEWSRKTEGCATSEEFFHTVRAGAKHYNMISGVPNFPRRSDVYYTHGELPPADPECRRLNEMLAFFSPSTDIDAMLLRVFFASPLYYRTNVPRPMWIIDSEHGQGAGKTKLVEMLALLYGNERDDTSSPIYVDHQEINSDTQHDRIMRRLLSTTARQKRILLLDNIPGHFQSASLARLCTQSYISGLAPYGRAEETRPMDLTICITANCATMDRDLIHRSFQIYMSKPEVPMPNWVKTVSTFISEHRLQILSDIIGILNAGAKFDSGCVSRCRDWEQEIMLPMLGSAEAHSRVTKEVASRSETSDSTVEEAATIRSYFCERIRAILNHDPDDRNLAVWIPSRVMSIWCKDALPGFGGIHARGAAQCIRNMVKNGTITELSDQIKFYPPSGALRSRGLMWNFPAIENDNEPRILGIGADGQVIEISDKSSLGL